MTELLEAYGWNKVDSNNEYMYSFEKMGERLNWYFTTGTFTVQSEFKHIQVFKKIDSVEKLEDALIKING